MQSKTSNHGSADYRAKPPPSDLFLKLIILPCLSNLLFNPHNSFENYVCPLSGSIRKGWVKCMAEWVRDRDCVFSHSDDLNESSQVNFIYIVQYPKSQFATRGFESSLTGLSHCCTQEDHRSRKKALRQQSLYRCVNAHTHTLTLDNQPRHQGFRLP